MSGVAILGPSSDANALEEIETLWVALHLHHLQVASYAPLVADTARSWQRRRAWYEQLLAAGGAYFTARTTAELVGYLLASVTRGDDDTFLVRGGIIEVVSLVVAEQARGEGVGRQLMAAAEQLAASRGCDTIRVAVMAGNDRASAFYASLGYSPAEHVLLRTISLPDGPTG